ncbi:MAG: hypothetical protein Q8L76_09750, partial [Cypionkella sp.]|nr:hypothetical protein [Cypionkella sp.]
MTSKQTQTVPGHACQVLAADAIYVINGVNVGDGLTGPEEVCPGDLYALDESQKALRLVVTRAE